MELSPTAKVILGMLRMRPSSGYDIKDLVDKSTRFFWSASYGSIYPELKRLREAGLIEGSEDPSADRRRVVYRLTGRGDRALEEWFAAEPAEVDLRDEALLKAFFADSDASAAAALAAKARAHERASERLREIALGAARLESPYPLITLRFGIALHDFCRDWCETEAIRLQREGGG